jgi:hypothetical protein
LKPGGPETLVTSLRKRYLKTVEKALEAAEIELALFAQHCLFQQDLLNRGQQTNLKPDILFANRVQPVIRPHLNHPPRCTQLSLQFLIKTLQTWKTSNVPSYVLIITGPRSFGFGFGLPDSIIILIFTLKIT